MKIESTFNSNWIFNPILIFKIPKWILLGRLKLFVLWGFLNFWNFFSGGGQRETGGGLEVMTGSVVTGSAGNNSSVRAGWRQQVTSTDTNIPGNIWERIKVLGVCLLEKKIQLDPNDDKFSCQQSALGTTEEGGRRHWATTLSREVNTQRSSQRLSRPARSSGEKSAARLSSPAAWRTSASSWWCGNRTVEWYQVRYERREV